MRLSTISRYGYRAMIELAKRGKNKTVSLKDIAKAQNIPIRYLENIMTRLVNANIVESSRGRGGGFKLVKNPEEISVFEVLNALESTLYPVPCIPNPATCERYAECGARDFLEEAYEAFVKVLKSHNLKEAAELEMLKIEKRRLKYE